jgi:biopolymer transport protein ExbD
MLSLNVSAIDIVLVMCMIVLLVLFIKQGTSKTTIKSESDREDQEHERVPGKLLHNVEKSGETSWVTKKKTATEQSSEGFQECVHNFGYLKTMPKTATVPNECSGCPNLVRCLLPDT